LRPIGGVVAACGIGVKRVVTNGDVVEASSVVAERIVTAGGVAEARCVGVERVVAAGSDNFGAKLGYVLSGNHQVLNGQMPTFRPLPGAISDEEGMRNMEIAMLLVPEVGEEEFAGQIHHIATDKGKTYKYLFKEIFDMAGMKLDNPENIMKNLPGHVGRHTITYHQHVLVTLEAAVDGEIRRSLRQCTHSSA
jgi:hypothetical protein